MTEAADTMRAERDSIGDGYYTFQCRQADIHGLVAWQKAGLVA